MSGVAFPSSALRREACLGLVRHWPSGGMHARDHVYPHYLLPKATPLPSTLERMPCTREEG